MSKLIENLLIISFVVVFIGVTVSAVMYFKSNTTDIEWRNCDTKPPNFSGVCCRWFEEQQEWECRRHTGDKGFSDEDNALVPWLEGIDPETQEREG